MSRTPPGVVSNQINVRGLDPLLWRDLKVDAARHGVTAAELLNRIIGEWLDSHGCTPDATGVSKASPR